MSTLKVDDLTAKILNAATDAVDGGIGKLSAFSKEYAGDIADYSALIARGAMPGGWIDDDDLPGWIKSLKKMVREFARMVAALIVIAVENVINAVLGVIKSTVESIIGEGRLAILVD